MPAAVAGGNFRASRRLPRPLQAPGPPARTPRPRNVFSRRATHRSQTHPRARAFVCALRQATRLPPHTLDAPRGRLRKQWCTRKTSRALRSLRYSCAAVTTRARTRRLRAASLPRRLTSGCGAGVASRRPVRRCAARPRWALLRAVAPSRLRRALRCAVSHL
jgi:hypothetical protein